MSIFCSFSLSAHLKLLNILRVFWTQMRKLCPSYIPRQPSSNLHFPEISMGHRVTVIWAEQMFGPWITARVLQCHPTQREDICSTRWESRTYTNVLMIWCKNSFFMFHIFRLKHICVSAWVSMFCVLLFQLPHGRTHGSVQGQTNLW